MLIIWMGLEMKSKYTSTYNNGKLEIYDGEKKYFSCNNSKLSIVLKEGILRCFDQLSLSTKRLLSEKILSDNSFNIKKLNLDYHKDIIQQLEVQKSELKQSNNNLQEELSILESKKLNLVQELDTLNEKIKKSEKRLIQVKKRNYNSKEDTLSVYQQFRETTKSNADAIRKTAKELNVSYKAVENIIYSK